jgi:hypothetical protein
MHNVNHTRAGLRGFGPDDYFHHADTLGMTAEAQIEAKEQLARN